MTITAQPNPVDRIQSILDMVVVYGDCRGRADVAIFGPERRAALAEARAQLAQIEAALRGGPSVRDPGLDARLDAAFGPIDFDHRFAPAGPDVDADQQSALTAQTVALCNRADGDQS